MRRTSPCGIRDVLRTRPPLKAPLLPTPAPTGPTSPSVYCAKQPGEASPKLPVAWCWAMALPGSGTPPGNCSPKPLRFSIGSTPRKLCTETGQSIFGATSQGQAWAAERCAELDAGKLRAVVHALRAHAASSPEAAKCALYIFRNRARMRYPKFHAQGFCYVHRRPGGWLQSGDRDPAQAGGHALERQWCKRHHHAAVLEAQRTL